MSHRLLEVMKPPAVRVPTATPRGGRRPLRSGGANTAIVEWRGAFYRAYPNNDPPPDKNDEAAVKAVTGVYRSGLAHLKKLVEGQ